MLRANAQSHRWSLLAKSCPYFLLLALYCWYPPLLFADRTILLPTNSEGAACALPALTQKLDECLARLIEEKQPREALRIQLEPGRYTLRHGVLLFERSNISIHGSSGTAPTVLLFDKSSTPTSLDRYFFSLIDSSQVTLQALHFQGAPQGSGAIGICPTEGRTMSAISIQANHASELTDYFTIVGNALDLRSAPLDFGTGAAGKRLQAALRRDPARAYCSGTFNRISFSDNRLQLKNVGFYAAPLVARQKVTERIEPKNWEQIADKIAHKNHALQIRNNSFIASIEGTGFDSGIHSAVKLEWVRDVQVEGNVFDAKDYRQVFGAGGALNIAMGAGRVRVLNNRFLFPSRHQYYLQAISLANGFGKHEWYGIGDAKLSVPAKEIEILHNSFHNAGIRLSEQCSLEPEIVRFCRAPFEDRVYIHANTLQADDDSPLAQRARSSADRTLTFSMCEQQQAVCASATPKPAQGCWVDRVFCRNGLDVRYEDPGEHPPTIPIVHAP
jgi:hypothetical protein